MSEAAERRALLICVGGRADENEALWRWATSCFLEPRDALSFVFARSETSQVLASNRVLHSQTPPAWMPPAIVEALDKTPMPMSPRFLEIVSDLSPGDAIVDWLERTAVDRADIVLLGSRGFTGLRRFLIGSVSSYIVESEAAPCLVVRSSLPRLPVCSGEASAATVRNEGGPSDVAATEIERGRVVAIAVDGSPAGTALVQWSRQFALRPRDRVFILHGRPDKPKTDDELEAIDRAIVSVNTALAALREVKEELDIAPVAEILPEGNVRDAIIDWVDTHRADVLVVGSRGLGGALKRAVLGSVSTYAIEHAACAVLVVSAPVLAKLAAATASEEAEASSVGVVVSHAVASAVAAGQQ